jgi:hypothetical protein
MLLFPLSMILNLIFSHLFVEKQLVAAKSTRSILPASAIVAEAASVRRAQPTPTSSSPSPLPKADPETIVAERLLPIQVTARGGMKREILRDEVKDMGLIDLMKSIDDNAKKVAQETKARVLLEIGMSPEALAVLQEKGLQRQQEMLEGLIFMVAHNPIHIRFNMVVVSDFHKCFHFLRSVTAAEKPRNMLKLFCPVKATAVISSIFGGGGKGDSEQS